MSDAPATRPVAPSDRDAATAMWAAYSASRRAGGAVDDDYTVEHFGDTARLADELLEVVLSGRKRATAELVSEFAHRGDPLPRIGSHWIACDSTGAPRIVIRSLQLRIGAFDTADAAFAFAEGEDDRTLSSWQREHRRYWERTCRARGVTWSEQDEIVFENFAVVWPPEHAD
ncbi:ASCH domain-containing protein [Frigoribacterium sp. MCBA15_019]|uniref:ASCH domain-containing protein n=1 Tax=unclassified Frigoribacterium TaxID=2627005 RepID=UPI0008DDB9D2|nr:ASCH domain-containing protein [Frigoribacterium sp. MCBA15_019]OII23528.1 ASCH domain-containing protein [Frigoribacterium sp. MCBA15_019]